MFSDDTVEFYDNEGGVATSVRGLFDAPEGEVFMVSGPPVPCGRPRVTRSGHTFLPKRTRDYENRVRCIAQSTFSEPLKGPVVLHIFFLCHNNMRRDVDNLAKSIMDGINGVAFLDDSQIVDLRVQKFVSKEAPCAIVGVFPVKDFSFLRRIAPWGLIERVLSGAFGCLRRISSW